MVVHRPSRLATWILDILLVVFHDARHELKKGVSDTESVHLFIVFIRIGNDVHEGAVDHFEVLMRALMDAICRLK